MAKKLPRKIPDLRAELTGITFEHCHVLVVKVTETINLMEGNNEFGDIENELDLSLLLRFFKTTYEVDTFNRLFQTELGKGVLVGSFVQELQKRGMNMEPTDG